MSTNSTSQESNYSTVVSRLRAAQVDARTENVRYRQDQLQHLHNCLAANINEILNAICNDTGYTTAEAVVEFSMALNALRHHYDSLDFDKAMEDEYQVTHGQDYADRCLGTGLAYIRPCAQSPFFSIMAPLTAAMTAGNCIILELTASLLALPALLRQILHAALDRDTFAIIDSPIESGDLPSDAVQVIQTGGQSPLNTRNVLQSLSSARTVAVVDRTADLTVAAKALVQSRFSFGGKSPYAPDLVLVNEFVKKPFLEAAVQEAIAYLNSNGDVKDSIREKGSLRDTLSKAVAEGQADVISLGSQGCIVETTSRNSSLLEGKLDYPLLAVLPFSSLDDGINFVNSKPAYSGVTGTPYLASYVFGHPNAAKYLGQFINAQACFLNIIPPQLLVGPTAPRAPSHPLSVALRYTKSMFETARPQFTQQSNQDILLTSILEPKPAQSANSTSADLVRSAVEPLKPTGQPLQARQIGFFEQGIITGLSLATTPIVLGLGFGLYFGPKYLLLRLR